MNNLIQNYEIILDKLIAFSSNITFKTQIRKPKLSDLELIALNLTAEYMTYSSELQLFRAIKSTYLEQRIERSVYNKRKRNLLQTIEHIRNSLSMKLSKYADLFIVDSKPLSICENVRANRSAICSTEHIKPAFGYCSTKKAHYFGYKLHTVCDSNGVIHSFDLTPANIHDIHYLKDVKYNLQNCELLADKGYLSAQYQQDLFTQSQIKLSVPMRTNQHAFVSYEKVKSKIRKRIETVFSQLDGQFDMKQNLAKTFQGLAVRTLSKITSFTMIQFLNKCCFNRTMNKTKINLC